MSDKPRAQRFCPACRRNVLGMLDPPDYAGHALLGFLTCGLWLVLAMPFFVLARPKYLCPQCGTLTRPAGRPPSASPQ